MIPILILSLIIIIIIIIIITMNTNIVRRRNQTESVRQQSLGDSTVKYR